MKKIRIFAFGGNEVAPVGLKDKNGKAINPDIPMQWQRTADTCRLVADIMENHPEDSYILTHGNGPQVGNILLRSEKCRDSLFGLPLDVCVADTQGAMSFMLGQLNNELRTRGLDNLVAGIVTQVVVDRNDPAFANPTKYVGQSYTKEEADQRTKDGWKMKMYKKDAAGNEIWRRVVPSPTPTDIVEIDAIEAMLEKGIVPITVGGGGVPVCEVAPVSQDGKEVYKCNYGVDFVNNGKAKAGAKMYTGAEAVIDKDLASALLGCMLMKRAKARGEEVEVTLTIFTGEDGAWLDYQKPTQRPIRTIKVSELEKLYNSEPKPFPAGSMGPKIKAVIEFVKNGGSAAYISKTSLFEETLRGEAGTTVLPD